MKFLKRVVWIFWAWVTALIIAFVDAFIALVGFHFSGITWLDGLGYWQLYWVNLVVAQVVATGAGLVLVGREFMYSDYLGIRESGRKFDNL